tara:strand:- start:6 stop:443 length:438 start_codon:yes stop_codon:yes gene_type:complete
MKNCIATTAALMMLSVVPFCINALDWQIYFYIHTKTTDWIIAPAQGTCHLAKASPVEEIHGTNTDAKSYRVGPLEIILENSSQMTPFSLGYSTPSEDSDYAFIEFPWLIFPALIFAGGAIATWRHRNEFSGANEPTNQPTPSQQN